MPLMCIIDPHTVGVLNIFCRLFFILFLTNPSFLALKFCEWIPTVVMWHVSDFYQEKIKTLNDFLSFESVFCKLCVFLITMFSSIFSFLVLIGPLTKKHTDDLSDTSDRTDDEGIFDTWCQTDCMTRATKPTLSFASNF